MSGKMASYGASCPVVKSCSGSRGADVAPPWHCGLVELLYFFTSTTLLNRFLLDYAHDIVSARKMSFLTPKHFQDASRILRGVALVAARAAADRFVSVLCMLSLQSILLGEIRRRLAPPNYPCVL